MVERGDTNVQNAILFAIPVILTVQLRDLVALSYELMITIRITKLQVLEHLA
jgi:hypothetical protein